MWKGPWCWRPPAQEFLGDHGYGRQFVAVAPGWYFSVTQDRVHLLLSLFLDVQMGGHGLSEDQKRRCHRVRAGPPANCHTDLNLWPREPKFILLI